MTKERVRTRIAPSPTGDPHIGTGYVALFNYAFAKRHGGDFLLRIEDTDQARSTKKSEEDILRSLKWLGISWAEGPDIGGPCGPYRQSERLDIYQKYAQILLDKKAAYQCICTQERLSELRARQQALKQPSGYDGRCRDADPAEIAGAIKNGMPHVLRLKTPQSGELRMPDLLRGEIIVSFTEVDDQVLMKSDGFPTYHLANVVDDHLMGITHVIRGEEWISSLPKHILLYEALGVAKPQFCHLPLLRNADKSKVSKRKNPVSLNYFKEAGYLPETMINFLGLMAYSMEDNNEMFSLSDFINTFELSRVSLGGPVFDMKKLLWLNGRYLREKLTDDEFVEYLGKQLFNQNYMKAIAPLVRERVQKSEDFVSYADFFFHGDIIAEPNEFLIGEKGPKDSQDILEKIVEAIESVATFDTDSLSGATKKLITDLGLKTKDVLMPMRMMICGKHASPPLFETMAVLGKERCRYRLRSAIDALKKL